jgi:hypothetical protein
LPELSLWLSSRHNTLIPGSQCGPHACQPFGIGGIGKGGDVEAEAGACCDDVGLDTPAILDGDGGELDWG